MIRMTNLGEFSIKMDHILMDLEESLIDAVDSVVEFVADQASLRSPVNPELSPTLQEDIEVTPASRQGNQVEGAFQMGGKAGDYAFLQHETLEIGESRLSYDVEKNRPRTRFKEDGVRRLGKLSVLKARQVLGKEGVKVGGQFVSRAVDENGRQIELIFQNAIKV